MMLLAAAAGITGCAVNQPSDEDAVRDLLAGSGYTSDENVSRYGSSDSTPGSGGDGTLPTIAGYQYIPFLRFARFIRPEGVTRDVSITIPAYPGWPDTTALAEITDHINGELRVVHDTTGNPILVWRKPFQDKAVRTVYLTRTEARRREPRRGWRIVKVSPAVFSTENAEYDLRIVRLAATARPSGETFELTTADTLLSKDGLPTFRPGDTVTVQLTVRSSGDSCWAFLHRGRIGNQRPRHWREAYWKTGTYSFERTWVIADEPFEGPSVRPSVHDAIGWSTLFDDTTGHYVAAAWGIPYIVREANDPLPDDE
jgi:hypothetical protein